MLIRFVLYGLLGWAIEIVWTALGSAIGGAQRGWRLAGTTCLWMFPIYGPRGLVYGLGFRPVEYAAGWLLRRLTGACPWDYTGRCRRHLHRLIRLDHGPLWALLGLACASSGVAIAPRSRRLH